MKNKILATIIGMVGFVASIFGILQFFNFSLEKKEPEVRSKVYSSGQSGGITADTVFTGTIITAPNIDSSITPPSLEKIKNSIDPIIQDFEGRSPLQIQIITSPINSIFAVAITPPYREFPNVILFNYDFTLKKWKRVFEGLSLGIQDKASKILDLHTIGEGVDLFTPPDKEAEVFASITASGAVVIPYGKFIHFHTAGRESYYIDKRDYPKYMKVLEMDSDNYPDNTCIMFDMPKVDSLSISYESGRYRISARTNNYQEWVVTFTGINKNGYLNNKKIKVRNLRSKS